MDISFLTQELQSNINQVLIKVMETKLQNLKLFDEETSTSKTSQKAASSSSSNSTQATAAGSSIAAASSTGSSTKVTGSFADAIQTASERFSVNANLIKAVIKAESNFNVKAVSSCGAQGLMQLMPATARSLGVDDAYDPEDNIEGGTLFLSKLLKRYDNNTELALAAYNAGPGAVDRYNGIPPYTETQTYVRRVMGLYQNYQNGSS